MDTTRSFLRSIDLHVGDAAAVPDSAKRFPDGASFRIEIPSTEGPRALEAVLDEATRREVPIHRVSQGSGAFLLTDAELDEMARIAHDARVEVSLFARPTASWGPARARDRTSGPRSAGRFADPTASCTRSTTSVARPSMASAAS
jgi:hypothetical protein